MALQAELSDTSIQAADNADLSVDDLKIVSEEELVNHALKKIVEVKISGATGCVPEIGGQEGSSSSLGHDSIDSSSEGVNVSGGTNVLLERTEIQTKRKRGRPYDRIVRAAAWGKGEVFSEESLYARLKTERENAKTNCCLQSLSVKNRQGAVPVRLKSNRRMQALNFFVSPIKIDTMAVISAVEQVPAFEVILWIEVQRRSKKQKAQSFLVLGSQMLTTLRDKIYCLTDELMRRAHIHVPSGYFHIENVFYNDLRDPTAIDYSIPILDWLNKQAVGEMRSNYSTSYAADMASTQFLDLQCRVGMQYVYCHQGDCKHDMVVRDMRLIHKEDIQNMLVYPLLRSQFRVRHRKCTICEIYVAKKVTYDDKMAPQSPCFFCDYCYYLLHYSQDGTLVYSDFRVYDYYHE